MLQYGCGGHGRVAFDAARSVGITFDLVADDDDAVNDFFGLRVIHPRRDWSLLPPSFGFLVAIGNNAIRRSIFDELRQRGGIGTNVVHRSAVISGDAHLGLGTLVCAGVVVNSGAQIGMNSILNTCASVDHDCRLGDHVHICPGVRLGGNVEVGSGTMIGLGAVVLPGVRVGPECIVGAGAVVRCDLPRRVVAYGVPARVRRNLNE